MPSLNNTSTNIKNMIFNKKFILICILIAIFLGVAFYVYNYYIAPRLNPDFVPNREFTHGDKEIVGSGVAELYLFSVDWCPFSKKIKPVWKQIKQKFQNKEINHSTLKFKEIDGDKDSKILENFENKFLNGKKVEGYPSIFLIKNNQVIEFEAKPTIDTLTEFINSVL
tara:strand:+ start:67 stop:570 length:504 start_codon:yes stop_codon:yes gene_type:complete